MVPADDIDLYNMTELNTAEDKIYEIQICIPKFVTPLSVAII